MLALLRRIKLVTRFIEPTHRDFPNGASPFLGFEAPTCLHIEKGRWQQRLTDSKAKDRRGPPALPDAATRCGSAPSCLQAQCAGIRGSEKDVDNLRPWFFVTSRTNHVPGCSARACPLSGPGTGRPRLKGRNPGPTNSHRLSSPVYSVTCEKEEATTYIQYLVFKFSISQRRLHRLDRDGPSTRVPG